MPETIRGGGHPKVILARHAVPQNGPATSEPVAEANGCFMVRAGGPNRIQGCGAGQRARYAGLTGSPDESGARRREKGLSKAGNARVRRGLIEFAWRFLLFQRESELASWFRNRVEEGGKRRKTVIVALARKLLVALWRLVHSGDVPRGVVLRPV